MILEKFTINPNGIVLEFDKSFTKITAVVHTSDRDSESGNVPPGCFSLKKETITVSYTIPKKILFVPSESPSESPSPAHVKVEIMDIDSQNCRANDLAYLFCTCT